MYKAFIILFIIVAVVVCSLTAMVNNQSSKEFTKPAAALLVQSWLVPGTDTDSAIIPCEALEIIEEQDRAQYEVSKERMVQEVVTLWSVFFDDDNASETDPRRAHFWEYAEYLVNAVLMYQETKTDIGGKLPKHQNTHLLLANMVTKESSVTPNVEGKRGEVGLIQIHGPGPMIAHNKRQVKENPKLGILLGARWLASRIPQCFPDGLPDEWNDEDWLGPLSVYAGGGKAYDKRKKRCKILGVAKKRVRKMKYYRTRVDHELRFYQD